MDTPIGIRKHLVLDKYLIATAVMPSSVKNGTIPSNKTVSLILNGKTISLIARPQGSLFYFDNTGANPVLIQLDKFHEAVHPERWSKSTTIEAELYDSLGINTASRETTPNSGANLDYSSFETYLTNLSSSDKVSYNFTANKSGNFVLQARIKTSGATTFSFELYDPDVSLLVPISTITSAQNTSGAFANLSLGTFSGLIRKNYILKVSVNATGSVWDYFALVKN
jgi:hypothetical protein